MEMKTKLFICLFICVINISYSNVTNRPEPDWEVYPPDYEYNGFV